MDYWIFATGPVIYRGVSAVVRTWSSAGAGALALVVSACAGGQSGTETPTKEDDPFHIMAVEGPCTCAASDGGVPDDAACAAASSAEDGAPACTGDDDGGLP
jgi:hypothetical protein